MVKCTLPPGVVPDQIDLSVTQQQELTDMADGVIAETLHAYESFVVNGRQLPSDQWKRVKSKEKVCVYRSRHSKQKTHSQSHDEKDPSRPRLMSANAMEQAVASGRPYAFDDDELIPDEEISTDSSSSGHGSFTLLENSVLHKVKPSCVPLLVATGQLDGKLEDVAFGGLANTKHAWLVRNSYIHSDHFYERKILATLQKPTEQDPFRSVTVKWGVADFGGFTTHRDILYLESQGMAFDSDGERIFYYIVHSLDLNEIPRLDVNYNIVRVKLSVSYITRQMTPDSVDMFGRGFADPGGDMIETYGVRLLAQNIASSTSVVDCSNLKKLSYLMALRRRSDASGIAPSSDCGVCDKAFNKLGSLLQTPMGCPICRRVTCSKCSIQKKLTVDVSDEITQKTFAFCLPCIIESKELSAWEVASAALVTN